MSSDAASAQAAEDADGQETDPGGGPGLKLAALAAGFVMATVDATVVNIAGAKIRTLLRLNFSELTWVIDGYVLTFASLLLLAGSLADRFGAKRIYLQGMAVFVVASAACGFASNGPALITARFVQGAGAALFMPASLTLLTNSFTDPKLRTRMVGLWTAIVSTFTALGPVIGGVLVGTLGWRSIFMLNLPIGVAGILLTRRYIAAIPAQRVRPRVLGNFLGVLGLVALSFTLIEGPSFGWSSVSVLLSGAAAVVLIGALVVQQRRSSAPIVPLALFREPRFTAANVVGFLINFGLMGGIFMLGLFLQNARGASPSLAGLQMLPMMAGPLLGNLMFARYSHRWGVRRPLIVALSLACAATAALIGISGATPYWMLAVAVAIANFGIGVSTPAMTFALMESAGAEHANIASSMLNTNRQFGGLVGVAVIGIALANPGNWYAGAHTSFLITAVCYGAAALLTLKYVSVAGRPRV
ncbi:DHA2 family efflux MFS transporter permease subunit [Streptomyces griseofuscus]|uniref:DHA2 family efflux MFS transporter permease subunit n=1 Tax=Streptomyces griseofuscus TaxID=146922 RepID=UPI0033F51AFE